MPTGVKRDSNMRRLRRFFAKYALGLDLITRMIFSLLPTGDNVTPSMDRTNWKFGEADINILMLGITYRGIAFPLLSKLLPKRGNSNWKERKYHVLKHRHCAKSIVKYGLEWKKSQTC